MQSNNNVKASCEFTKIYNFLLWCLLVRDTDLTRSSLKNRLFRSSSKTDFSYTYTTNHCVKIVHIRSYSSPHFSVFGLNTERYSASLYLSVFSPNAGKYVPQNLRIWALFSQWILSQAINSYEKTVINRRNHGKNNRTLYLLNAFVFWGSQ